MLRKLEEEVNYLEEHAVHRNAQEAVVVFFFGGGIGE